jgi:hypothetical protein
MKREGKEHQQLEFHFIPRPIKEGGRSKLE